MAGRPPTPTALKLLNGSARHDPQRINKDEPKPALGAVPPPYLPTRGPARAAWDRLVPTLSDMRVLTVADAEALALGCMALAEYLAARRARGPQASWHRADAAWKRYAQMLRDFGMTPSARARVHAAPASEADPLEQWAAK